MIVDNTDQRIFVGYHGNRLSWKLSAYFNTEKYKLVFENFERTQPTREQKKNGEKATRVLLQKKTFFFNTLDNIEPPKLPCPQLGREFKKNMLEKQKPL